MKKAISLFTAGVVLAGACAPALAVNDFIQDKQRGWFFREMPPEPIEPEPVKPEPPKPDPKPDPKPETKAEPAPFSVEWLNVNLPKLLNKAIDNPTPENIAAYKYAEKLMMDKAEKFSLMHQQVLKSDPMLDASVTSRPSAAFAQHAIDDRAKAAQQALVAKLAKTTGLWFFYKSDCEYCKAEVPVIKEMIRKYKFNVLPVALDGRPLPGNPFPDFKVDKGQGAQLGVDVTPTIFMFRPPNNFVMVAAGAVTTDDLLERIVSGAQQAGWISKQEFDKTRKTLDSTIDTNGQNFNPADLNDPNRMTQILRELTRQKYQQQGR